MINTTIDDDSGWVHVASAVAESNPDREKNMRTIASRLRRFNQMEDSHTALVRSLDEMLSIVEDEGHSLNYVPQCKAAREALALAERGGE